MTEKDVTIGPLQLQSGERIESVVQRVTIYGDPSARRIFIPHALTGSSRVRDWWPTLVGPGRIFDPQEVCVIGINALGGCYGSTGPNGDAFPYVTVKDMVSAQQRALSELDIPHIDTVIGASLGGMQALQWALDFPEQVRRAVLVGSHDHQSAMGIALNTIQREAIAVDPRLGIRIARKIAMLSYKSDELFRERHDRRPDRRSRFRFDIEGYLEHQAEVFEARMNPQSYVTLTHAMDSFDVRDRAEPPCHAEHVEARLSLSKPSLLFIGISSDWLFLPQDVRSAAERFARFGYDSQYREIVSDHGHDAFLAEPEKLTDILATSTYASPRPS